MNLNFHRKNFTFHSLNFILKSLPMKNLSVISMCVAFSLLFISCTKEGPQGPQGNPGLDGNANVHSYLYHVTSWTLDGTEYYNVLLADYITQDILDNGAVLVYMSNGSGSWLALPFTMWYNGYGEVTSQVISVGGITIWVSDSDLAPQAYPGNIDFKVVAIGGSTKSAMSAIDLKDYSAVAKFLKLGN
jgi:hypothetical protein